MNMQTEISLSWRDTYGILYLDADAGKRILNTSWSETEANTYVHPQNLLSIHTYSFRVGKKSRLGQRHSLQNITLIPCYYKNIYKK